MLTLRVIDISGIIGLVAVRANSCLLGAPDYESGGQEFESLRARQWNQRFLSNIDIIPSQNSDLGRSWGRWGGFTTTPTAQVIDVSRIRERWWQLTWRVPDPSFGESD